MILFISLQSFFITAYKINLPGMGWDEVRPTASFAIQYQLNNNIAGTPLIKIFNFPIVLIRDGYVGGFESVMYMLTNQFIQHPQLYRYISISFAVIVAILFFLTIKNITNNLLSSYLFTTTFILSSSFVFLSRIGITHNYSKVLFGCLIFYIFIKFLKTNSYKYLYIFSFINGLSIAWVRLDMAWMTISTIVFFVIFERKKIRECLRLKNFFILLTLFLLGMTPFFVYNFLSDYLTFKLFFGQGTSSETIFFHDNTAFFYNIGIRIGHIIKLLDSRALYKWDFALVYSQIIPLIYFGFALLWFLYKRTKISKYVAYTITVIIVSLLLSTYSVSNIMALHLMMIYPFLYVLIFISLFSFFGTFHNKALLYITIFILMISNGFFTYKYYESLKTTKGVGRFTDKITDLYNYLRLYSFEREVYYLDWGISENIYTLSKGKIPVKEIFQYRYAIDQEFINDEWSALLIEPQKKIIVAHDHYTQFKGRIDLLKQYLSKHNLKLTVEKKIYDEGYPIFIIYSIQSNTEV